MMMALMEMQKAAADGNMELPNGAAPPTRQQAAANAESEEMIPEPGHAGSRKIVLLRPWFRI